MMLRGVILQARKAIVTRQFGTEAWTQLFRDVSDSHACLRAPITHATVIPLPAYLAFHDEMMRRLFREDDESNFQLGAEAARWTLEGGPLRSFMKRRDLGALVTALPDLWKTFFLNTTSHAEATLETEGVRFKAFDLPEHHRYFEPFIIGYNKEVLEMFCANPITATRIRGGSGNGYHYLYHFASPRVNDSEGAPAPGPTGPKRDGALDRKDVVRRSVPSLTDRQAEILLLLAEGLTNEQIGDTLGISGKTAQHHISSAYNRIGVSGRVGATVWLAQRGLIGK